MGLIRRFFAGEKRAHPGSHADWSSWFGGGMDTHAGVSVTVEGSLTLPAVFACVSLISEEIATLPLLVYRRQGRGKERAIDHPLYGLLHDAPNPEMTPADFRGALFSHVLTWGNGYANIERNRGGEPIGLWPLRPDKMTPVRMNGSLVYRYILPDGQETVFRSDEVHHVRGLGFNGITGYSPIRMAMQAVGLGLATEEFGSRFFSNGARPGVVFKHPGQLSEEAYGRLKRSLEQNHGGLSNAHRIKILEEGMDIATIGIPPEEAQFLETRKFQALEIARIFRVPPHMIGDLDRATFSNIEEQSLNFVIHTLRPWLVRHEQAIKRDLILSDQRQELFAEYLVDGLLRGNIQGRYMAYSVAVQNGWMNRNEIRELENMNPADGLDEYLVPLNMIEVGSMTPTPAPETEPAEGENRSAVGRCTCGHCDGEHRTIEQRAEDTDIAKLRRARQAMIRRNVRLFTDASARLVAREVADIRRAMPKQLGSRSISDFRAWLERFYNELREVIPTYYLSLMLTYAEHMAAEVGAELGEDAPEIDDQMREFVTRYLENLAGLYVASSEGQLRALLDEAESEEQAEELISTRLDEWQEKRAGKFGLYQAFEAGNALANALYAGAGVAYLRWSASGESCPYCRGMDGKRIPIDGVFVEAGGSVNGGEGDEPMLVKRTTRHAPLHSGCDCVVLAG